MCGLIASLSKTPTLANAEKVKKQFNEQRSRGTQGFGFVAIEDGTVIYAKSETEQDIMDSLDKLSATTLIVFHHRIPTCNFNSVRTNHPILIASKKNLKKKYFIVHNGSISNSDSLRTEHEEEGYLYRTDVSYKREGGETLFTEHTDSESLGIELAKFIEQKTSRIKARGSVATFVLQMNQDNKPEAFYAFRETNPINFYRNQENLFMASAAQGIPITSNKLFRLDLDTWELCSTNARLTAYNEIGNTEDPSNYANFQKVIREKKKPLISAELDEMNERINDAALTMIDTRLPKARGPVMIDLREGQLERQVSNILTLSPHGTHSRITAPVYLSLVDNLKFAEFKMEETDFNMHNLEEEAYNLGTTAEEMAPKAYKLMKEKYVHWEKRYYEIFGKLVPYAN